MNPTDTNQPSLARVDGKWELVLERTLEHPIEEVWAALTESGQLPSWGPFAADRDLTEPGPVQLAHMNNPEEDERRKGEVLTVEAPRLLVFRWGRDILRWELSSIGSQTILILRHSFTDDRMAPSYAAGWHLCLIGLTGILAGKQMPSMTGSNAFRYGWKELHDQFAKLFEAGNTLAD
ncbi:SRPBCC family protein [Cohnella sp. REN36]|uniref:SRPBCC family protein n=1 Tax=Cohnella sp. REN36 TaxID=2887347 RepID=UPI001D143A52|nr:SRPBCC family protein [Cohnella sp. REN36]MCC3372284.1 SRPBCC family protein [Cohnella sp. REN36]